MEFSFLFWFFVFFFFFKQKTAYEMLRSLVGSEMCIRDSNKPSCLLAAGIVVGDEPVHGSLDTLCHGDELSLGAEAHQLGIVSSLLELTIGLGGIEYELALVPHGLLDHAGHISDADLVLLAHGQDNGLDGVVLA
eukprot:TRINITY_DN5340_c0_g1_i10.p1 TRINITY_DN5340_c0_g1~~TRINITY_DN5340_c0_g1_i10.p1  ORF type:complete len:135 (+),score=33.85 TRINITY_DN5340_c0_g1_i10:77-481(+)